MGDTHIHYRQIGLERVVEEASRFGCQYLAFTEHAQYTEYLEAQPGLIAQALAAHPEMLLINGTEWNSPAGDAERSEQVGLLVPGVAAGVPFLRDFLSRYDTQVAGIRTSEEGFLEALRFLSHEGEGDVRPTAILTHPKGAQEAFTVSSICAGLQAGPALAGLCASSRPPRPGELEVWPWTSQVGGTCDRLFARGCPVVMLAESHLHRHGEEEGGEFWPGEFRRNYLYCPERTEAGFFRGLRSGACYFVLADIVRDVAFTASAGGESIMMGETLSAEPGQTVTISLGFVEKVRVEAVELIGNPGGEVRVVARARIGRPAFSAGHPGTRGKALARSAGRKTWTVEVRMESKPCYLRARGSTHVSQPYPMTACFYTNPLWLTPAAAWGGKGEARSHCSLRASVHGCHGHRQRQCPCPHVCSGRGRAPVPPKQRGLPSGAGDVPHGPEDSRGQPELAQPVLHTQLH